MLKTLERIKCLFYWPEMTYQIREYVRSCQVCKECKPSNQRLMSDIGQEVIPNLPFQKLYMDFLGKYPRSKSRNCYIFIVEEHFTKYTFLKAMREATTKKVIQFMVEEIVPEVIHTDNGVQFVAKEFRNMTETYKIHHIYSPQSKASERVNQSVLNAIRA